MQKPSARKCVLTKFVRFESTGDRLSYYCYELERRNSDPEHIPYYTAMDLSLITVCESLLALLEEQEVTAINITTPASIRIQYDTHDPYGNVICHHPLSQAEMEEFGRTMAMKTYESIRRQNLR